MKLVDEWKQCWKWLSVHCMTLGAAIQGAWLYIPEDMKQSMPPQLVTVVTIALLALGVFGRLIKQGKS